MKLSGGLDSGTTEAREIYLELGWKKVKIAENPRTAMVQAAVPSSVLTFRTLTLPFTDQKRIREIIREELSDTLAIPLESTVWDFSRNPDGSVFVVIAPTEALGEKIKELPKNIQALDAEPFALVRTALYCGIKDGLIIDFGASKTLFCGLRNGAIDFIRVLLRGGGLITELIMKEMQVSLAEAESIKREKGLALSTAREEIIKTLRTAGLPSPFPYPQIVITGRGAQIPGLQALLQESLKTQVATFSLPEDLSPYTYPVAFGMALRGKEYGTGVNLMEEKKSSHDPLVLWAAGIILPLLLCSASLMVHEAALVKEAKAYKAEINKVVKKEFPEITVINRPLDQLRDKVSQKAALAENRGPNILGIFDSISQVIRGKDIIIYEFDFSESTVTITGEAASYQEVEFIRKGLLASFEKVELREGKTLPSRRITFNLTITLKGTAQDGHES
ncbi:MAG: GspL/Epsl periplasmic domain-containing protein [Candidatus Eremiobacteraeota bacterium]|nr:GspL/Epsl periplasmic domain-containing protein [Candidatus Eremiobacteraeota bacterium]